jgi:hypothetical protein
VPNLWNKTPEAPSSELNPLTNPVLEQHLGRWAKVYFSTPPANREQAVIDLLEEIKRESAAAAAGRPYFTTDPKFQRAVCAACQHHNPPGHKFCSRCGQTLNPGQPAVQENRATTRASQEPASNPVTDVGWIREQAFGGMTDSYAPRKQGWKYALGATMLVLAGFAYMRWAPDSRTKIPVTPAPRTSVPATTLRPQNASPAEGPAEADIPAETAAPESEAPKSVALGNTAPLNAAPLSKDRKTENLSENTRSRRETIAPSRVQSAVQRSRLLDASRPTVADPGSSSPDVRLAQRYLGGSMGVRDSAEAAKLLWKAVGKQNATAAVLLSDLYLRGDGVPRSCDQARLLLVAAAKRGSPLAAQQLRNLESRGCR